MQNLQDMYLFAKVVDAGSFSAAARELGLQTSLLSRRVASLERALGVRLLNRTTRKLAPTETGRAFHRHCQALAAEAEEAWASVEHSRREPRGLVRMSCPEQMLRASVGGIVTRFMVRHPAVRVQVEVTGRRVDVIEEGIDIALRVRAAQDMDPELVTRQLGAASGSMVAAPALFSRLPRPRTLADLAGLPTLSQVRGSDQQVWEFIGPDGGRVAHRHTPRLAVDDFTLLRDAAVAGLGVAALPHMITHDDVVAGRLEPVLPQYSTPQGIAHAAFASRRGMLPAVRALLDALAAEFTLG